MDFDSAWCPACDREIQPKRYTVNVPTPPTAPPPSPKRQQRGKTGGLVGGTGRLRANGTIKPPTKQRVVIEQGPIPLYCSDECQFADLHTLRRDAPLDPAREEKPSPPPITCRPDSDDASDVSSASLSSIDKLAAMYNFPPLPPPMPTYDDAPSPPQQYTSGIMMAGRLITSLCPPPAKPHVGRYRPVQEPRKPVPGWTDGSNAWRAAVYSCAKSDQGPFHRRDASVPPTSPTSPRFTMARKAASSCALSSAPAAYHHPASPSSYAAEEMISKFSETFIRRSESRVSLYNNNHPTAHPTAQNTATPSSPVSTHSLPLPSPRRERHLVHPGAQGKLLVPNVTMKVNSGTNGSSASLSSVWSGPSTTASSRRSVRSPLSAASDSDEETERCDSAMSRPKRPVENTRSWSYDNVKTYDMMPVQPKKVIKREKTIVDGEEQEVEVEMYEEPKRLFLFAPTRISR